MYWFPNFVCCVVCCMAASGVCGSGLRLQCWSCDRCQRVSWRAPVQSQTHVHCAVNDINAFWSSARLRRARGLRVVTPAQAGHQPDVAHGRLLRPVTGTWPCTLRHTGPVRWRHGGAASARTRAHPDARAAPAQRCTTKQVRRGSAARSSARPRRATPRQPLRSSAVRLGAHGAVGDAAQAVQGEQLQAGAAGGQRDHARVRHLHAPARRARARASAGAPLGMRAATRPGWPGSASAAIGRPVALTACQPGWTAAR